MGNFYIIFLVFVLIFLASNTFLLVRINREPQPRFFGSNNTLTANPAPGRTGPYQVCTNEYEFEISPGNTVKGIIYAPVLDSRSCVTVNRKFNLVIIAHADGTNVNYLAYDELARHLATNALVTVSVHRHPDGNSLGAWTFFDQVLVNNLDYLYNHSGIQDLITNNVALVGHSAGGKSVIYNADVVNQFNKNLRAVIVLAPTVENSEVTLNGVTSAFLGVHITGETDINAYGSKFEDKVMGSTFKIYDEVGLLNDANAFGVEKDHLFVRHSTLDGNAHYFQNESFTLAYVNAFLQVHLNGHNIFRRFFKNQNIPPSLTAGGTSFTIWHQHEDKSRLTLANFENGDRERNTLGGDIEYSAQGIGFAQVEQAHIIDPFSPHHSSVLYFDVIPASSQTEAGYIRFEFPQPTDLGKYRYVGFRIAQVYHPTLNPTGVAQDIQVTLDTLSGSDILQISNFGGSLHFPFITPLPFLPPAGVEPEVTVENSQTKNAMRSYLINLRDFEAVDQSNVVAIILGFEDVTSKTQFMLDDIAFYKF